MEQPKSQFWITKSGEVFASEDGMELFNNYKSEDLPQPDSVDVSLDPLTGEVSIIEYEYDDPSKVLEEEGPRKESFTSDTFGGGAGSKPRGIGAYPSPQSTQSYNVQVPSYISPDTAVADEEKIDGNFTAYKAVIAKSLETQRDRENRFNEFLKLKALYSTLQKGWNSNDQIAYICRQTKNLMGVYKDAEFLNKAARILLNFDPTLPNTRFVKHSWISKVHEIPKERIISFQKSAEGGHYYVSGPISDTLVDRDADRFTRSALDDMKRALDEGALLFRNHEHNVQDTLGVPIRSEIRDLPDGNALLWAEFRLEDPEYNPEVRQLIHKLETGERLGFSIGGDGDSKSFGYEEGPNGRVRTIGHLSLYETSIVGIPSNPRSFVGGVVFKSLRRPNPHLNYN